MKQVKHCQKTLAEVLQDTVVAIIQQTSIKNDSGSSANALGVKKEGNFAKVNNVFTDQSQITVNCTTINTNETISITISYYSVTEVPDIDSIIMIDYDLDDNPYISKVDDLDYLNINSRRFINLAAGELNDELIYLSMLKDKINLGDTSFGGLIKIQELTDKLNKLVDTVTDINKRLGEHKHTYNAYPAVPTSSSAPEQAPLTPYIPVPDPSEFDKADYENEYVVHGKSTKA